AAVLAETEPMHGASGKMNKCAWRCRLRLGTNAEIDLALHDKEGLIPGMTVRRRATALGPALQEDLIALGRLARSEHGDVFAPRDVERSRVILWRDDERFCSHLGLPFRCGHSPIRREWRIVGPSDSGNGLQSRPTSCG